VPVSASRTGDSRGCPLAILGCLLLTTQLGASTLAAGLANAEQKGVAERRPSHLSHRLASDRIVEVRPVERFLELPGVCIPMTEVELRDVASRFDLADDQTRDLEGAIAAYLRDSDQFFRSAMTPILARMDSSATRGAIIGSIESATTYRELLRDASHTTTGLRSFDAAFFDQVGQSLDSEEKLAELARLRSIRARNDRADATPRVGGADVDVESLVEWFRSVTAEPIDLDLRRPILADYASRASILIPSRIHAAIDLLGRGSMLTATRLAGGGDTLRTESALRTRLAQADEAVVRLNLEVVSQLRATLPPTTADELERLVFERSSPRTYPDPTEVAPLVRAFADSAELESAERAGLLALVDAAA